MAWLDLYFDQVILAAYEKWIERKQNIGLFVPVLPDKLALGLTSYLKNYKKRTVMWGKHF